MFFVSALSLSNYYFKQRYHKEDNRSARQYLTSEAAPYDLVICRTNYTDKDLKHYSDRDDITIVRFPVKTIDVNADEISQALSETIAGRDRFWLFLSRTFHSDPKGYLRKYCDETFYRSLELKNSGIELILYTQIKWGLKVMKD